MLFWGVQTAEFSMDEEEWATWSSESDEIYQNLSQFNKIMVFDMFYSDFSHFHDTLLFPYRVLYDDKIVKIVNFEFESF